MSEKIIQQPGIKFVNLHCHSTCGSPFDALGYPQEYMDYAVTNGMKALALTDHGNCNGLGYQVLHAKKIRKEGVDFKPIYGAELYFIPSIEDWEKEHEEYQKLIKSKKKVKDEISGVVIENSEETQKEKSKINKRHHLLLLVQNQLGLNNLFKLISSSYRKPNFYRFPRIDFKMLERYNEGLLVATACVGGVLAKDYWQNKDLEDNGIVLNAMKYTVKNFQKIFGDRFYGELQWNSIPEQHIINQNIISLSQEMGFELISTADCHYPKPNLWKDREIYKRIGWLNSKDMVWKELPESINEIGYELYPKNGDQMWESYKRHSKACRASYDDDIIKDSIERTHHIAFEKIEDFYPNSDIKLPEFVIPKNQEPDKCLILLCKEKLIEKNLHKDKKYVERVVRELKVINGRGFSKYFLTMKAISDKAHKYQLCGCGRGSAPGSLVSYILGITEVDPVRWGLSFERFLRSDAVDWPDIDFDVSQPVSLKQKLIEDWGENSVVPISNWNTLQLKSLVKDISRFYNIPFKEVNEVTNKMMFEAIPQAKKEHNIRAGVYTPTFAETEKYSKTFQLFLEKYPQVKKHIVALLGQVKSASQHAGGVLCAENLDEHMPLINSGGTMQTPWSEGQHVRHLEPLGFIKFDILGLATLRMMEEAIKKILIKENGGKEPTFEEIKSFYDTHLHPDVIDFKSEDIYRNIFHNGKWIGVFQFTAPGAQKFCQTAKPTSVEEISNITAIYRPGPLSISADKTYVEAKNTQKHIKYNNKIIKNVLEPTYGLLIYQEQIASLAHQLGDNISIDEGNTLRKLLTKKGTGKEEEKQKLKDKFIKGCIRNNMTSQEAKEIYQMIEYFSNYGFNKCLEENTFVETKSGKKKIKDVTPGDFVNSKNGFVMVKKVFKQGKKKVYRGSFFGEGVWLPVASTTFRRTQCSLTYRWLWVGFRCCSD